MHLAAPLSVIDADQGHCSRLYDKISLVHLKALPGHSNKYAFAFSNTSQPFIATSIRVVTHAGDLASVSSIQTEASNRDAKPSMDSTLGVFESVETLRKGAPTRESANDPSLLLRAIAKEARILSESPVVSSTIKPHSNQREISGPDSLQELHHLLEKEMELGVVIHQGTFSREETFMVMEKLRDVRKKSMEIMIARRSLASNFFCALDPESLLLGEYVVHKTKGIGQFVRLHYDTEKKTDYVILRYADGLAKLKAEQSSRLLYRYFQSGTKGKAPALSKLSDPRQWEKKKSKGKLAAQKMVVDLLQLYINRLKQRRPPYPRNEEAMCKFAVNFPYKPTPDQAQAFEDVERDLVERDMPMDRLICGDVGFGKTEVALRAIFQVFSSGKQAMILAPTTVLARQHYNVVRERFSDYNAKVAFLSRFQTVAEKRRLAAEIKSGAVDIIVGTQALLSSNIHYSNLGLLVVDEEQRFGVKQKERISSFKTSVDVLTLSATPIPRTLYLALTGFRDASLITTPPPERVPIITHLLEYDEETMKAAVQFELQRGGQVYYVLPRLQGIELKKIALEALFPEVRIGIAHGKQSAALLEETMDCFAQGELEILLCTNIIESGLDIRRVNTIIVEDVQYFGLAQVYQLRGRVGRADKEAHAYLFYPEKDLLTDEALERLVSLQECCDLGQGFNLAERDLAIRGFGSIFGEKQSGEVTHMGMDLFFDMLFETLSKEAENHVFFQYNYNEVKLDLEVNHHLPSDYIKDPQKCGHVLSTLEDVAASGLIKLMYYTNDLRCDFGKETPSFEIVLKMTYIKRLAADLGIHYITLRQKAVIMETGITKTFFEILREGMNSDSLRASLTFQDGVIELALLLELSPERVLERILACLVDLRKGLSVFARQ